MYRLVFCGCIKAFDVTYRETSWLKMIQEGINNNMENRIKVHA
jgi:hypothetical protein